MIILINYGHGLTAHHHLGHGGLVHSEHVHVGSHGIPHEHSASLVKGLHIHIGLHGNPVPHHQPHHQPHQRSSHMGSNCTILDTLQDLDFPQGRVHFQL